MNEAIEIDIARDFTPDPGPREIRDGEWSGELFRIKYLEPHIESGAHVVVNLEGCTAFLTSFLEEAFGGLVRRFGAEVVRSQLAFVSPSKPHRVDDAKYYIDRAIKHARKAR